MTSEHVLETSAEVNGQGAFHRGFRLFLLVALALLMPVCRVFLLEDREVNFSLADPILLAGAVYLAFRFLRQGVRTPMLALFVLNLATLVLSGLVNIESTLHSRGLFGVPTECIKTTVLWLNVFVVATCVESRRDFLVFVRFWIVASVVAALLGAGGSLAYQIAGIESEFSLMYRAHGTFGDANLYATHLSLSFFLTLFYQKLRGGATPWTVCAGAIQLFGIVLSASRGGLLALGGGLFLLWLMSSSLRTKLWSAAAVLAAGLVLLTLPNRQELMASNPVTARLATATTDLSSPEAAERKSLWIRALESFQQSPLLGVGRGNYGLTHRGAQEGNNYAHNTYLQLLCEVGILGAAVYALVLLRAFGVIARARLQLRPARLATASEFLLVALATVVLGGLTINLENYRGAWLLLGIVECFRRLYVDAPAREAGERAARGGEAVAFEPAATAS